MSTDDFLAGMGFLAALLLLSLLMLMTVPDGHAEAQLVMPTEVRR